MKTQDYVSLWKELDEKYLNWKSLFINIRDYVLPGRGKFIDAGDSADGGENRYSKILNGTAARCLNFGAAGIHGHLTSPARPWFRLLPPDPAMLKSSAVRQWLQYVEKLIYNIYQKTNFYQCVHSIYQEEMGFGTGVLYQEEDSLRVCRFRVLTGGEYRLALNSRGEVDTICRLFYMTAKQMVEQFGFDAVSDNVQRVFEKSPNESFKVLHVVRPNTDRKGEYIDSANKPYESVHIEYDQVSGVEDKGLLRKKGYEENPFTCPRWDVISNEAYGSSPAHNLLGEIKTLQVMRKDLLEALHKTIDPPMTVPTTMKDGLARLPGGINWVDPGSLESIKPLYQINFDIQSTKADMKEIEQQIREGFYNDLFLMLSSSPGIQPKNMLEIMELQEEKLIMLGPVIERQFSELLNPTIARTFNIAYRNHLIPPVPPELANSDVKVEYVSFLAQAQKKIGIQSISSTVGFVINLAGIVPDALDKLDADKAIDAYAEIVGSPQEMIRDDKAVLKIRDAKAQAMQQEKMAQMMDVAAQGAKAAKQLAGADTSGKNALTDMMNQEQ